MDVMNHALSALLRSPPVLLVLAFVLVASLLGAIIHVAVMRPAGLIPRWKWVLHLGRWAARLRFSRWFLHSYEICDARQDASAARASGGDEHSELAGHFIGVIGVIYAVLLAFVVVTAWQQFDHAEEISMQEQRDAESLFAVVGAYDPTHPTASNAVQPLMADFALSMAGEWDQMQRGDMLCDQTNFVNEIDPACQPGGRKSPYGMLPASRTVNDLLLMVRNRITQLRPIHLGDQSMYQESVVLIDDLIGARDHRRRHYAESMPAILWIAYVVGAIVAIGVPYAGRRDWTRQLVRTVALCALIGLMFGLTLVFDYPFSGKYARDGHEQWCSISQRFSWHLNRASTQWEHLDACPSLVAVGKGKK